MKFSLKREFNPLSFLKAVDGCAGEVMFESAKGDRLDLKSQLCKVLFLTLKPEDPTLLDSRIECSGEDGGRLSEFLAISE